MDESSDTRTKDLVWAGLVESESLSRYYGRLAGKLARTQRRMAIAGCAAALIGAFLFAEDVWPGFATALVVFTGIMSGVIAVQAGQSGVSKATYCFKTFDDLNVEWRTLWDQRFVLKDEQLLTRWADLSKQANDATALSPVDVVDHKILAVAENETRRHLEAFYGGKNGRKEIEATTSTTAAAD